MGRSKYKSAPIGKLFGKWLVTDYSHCDNEHYWTVTCTGCSTQHIRRASQLVRGRSSGCQGCNSFEREKYSFWEGIDGISTQYLGKLKHRKKTIEITLQDLVDQWHTQGGLCRYSKVPLTLVQRDTKWVEFSASIDRIDPSKGYIKGNIQWVHKRINTMKNDMTEIEFVNWCNLVVQHGGSFGV